MVTWVLWSLFSSHGQVFSLRIHLTECQVHSEVKFLPFSAFSVRHCFGIWVSFISPNYVLGFSTRKGNSLCVFIFWRPHGHSYASSPGDEWMASYDGLFYFSRLHTQQLSETWIYFKYFSFYQSYNNSLLQVKCLNLIWM